MRVEVESRHGRVNCPFCHGVLGARETAWECPKCGTLHHRECAAEYGKCSLLGCGAPSPARSANADAVRPRRRVLATIDRGLAVCIGAAALAAVIAALAAGRGYSELIDSIAHGFFAAVPTFFWMLALAATVRERAFGWAAGVVGAFGLTVVIARAMHWSVPADEGGTATFHDPGAAILFYSLLVIVALFSLFGGWAWWRERSGAGR